MKKKQRSNFIPFTTLLALIFMIMMAFPASNTFSASPSSESSTSSITLIAETHALNGEDLMESRCAVCHGSDKVKQARKTHEQWEKTVNRMVSKGAKLNEAETKVLVDFLSETYGK